MNATTGRPRRVPWDLAIALVALCAAGCAEEVRSDPEVAAADTRRLSLPGAGERATEADGYVTHLYSERDADVYTRMFGDEGTASGIQVRSIQVEIGDRVRRGQLLATLDDEMAALGVEMTRPSAEETRRRLERVEKLKETGVVTPSEYEEVLYASQLAEAELKQAELYLARTRVRAPFDGVVSRRYVREGELVGDRDPLFRITALSPLRARLLVPEGQAGAFRLDSPVRLAGSGGRTTTARVILVGPTVDPGSGTREVIVELQQPDGFTPGATVTAEVAAEAPPKE